MTPEEMQAKAIEAAVDAANSCDDTIDPNFWVSSNMMQAAIAAYHDTLYGTPLPPQATIVSTRKMTPADIEELRRRWSACEPMPDGFKVIFNPSNTKQAQPES